MRWPSVRIPSAPPCSPGKPPRFPGRQKPSQFRSVSEAQRGLRTEFRPFSRVLHLKSPAGLSPQNSVSRMISTASRSARRRRAPRVRGCSSWAMARLLLGHFCATGRIASEIIKERLTQCSAAERLFLLSGQVMDRAVVQPLSVRTSLAGFPCFVAERDEPAQPLEVRVAERSRLEADEDYLEHRPRRRPVAIAVVQPPLRGGNRLVYDFDNIVGHGASHVFSPARVPRWRPQTRRR